MLGFTTGGVTTVLDRLERAGYARRRADTTDRRRLVVETTTATAARDQQVFGDLTRQTADLVANYTDHQLAVKGSKIAEPPPICTATPATNTILAHRLTASRTLTGAAAAAGRGQARTLTPGRPAISDGMAAGMRPAFGRTATTVANDAANTLLY